MKVHKWLFLSVICVLLASCAWGAFDPTASAKTFVTQLSSGDYAGAVKSFDATMKSVMSAEKLSQTWRMLITQAGVFQGQGDTRTAVEQGYQVVYVTCRFEKAVLDTKVVFNNANQISGLWFLPHTAAPQPPPVVKSEIKSDYYTEKEVTIDDGSPLPGTLTMPTGKGPFPAIVLVHGSGPNDRDETIGANKPFRDLAHGLAAKGIAVLRYDKRTKVYPTQMTNTYTVKEEVVDDTLAAVSLLRKTEGINANRIFVLGHSLGGMVIPRIGLADSGIAGFVIMAGATRPLGETIIRQLNYIFSLDGKVTKEEKQKLADIKAQVAKINSPKLARDGGNILGAPPSYWLDLRGYNPPEAAKNIKQPMLILQGGRDYQVTTEDFSNWKNALSSRKDVTFKLYPALNHLFIEGVGKSTPDEYNKSGHVAPFVIDDIASWIGARSLDAR